MSKSVDYIIVGAGPTGACAANILSKSGKKVVLVGKVLGGSHCSISSTSSETLMNLSKSFEKFRVVNDAYVSSNVENVALDFKKVKKLVDSNANKSKKSFLEILEDCSVEFIEGTACFSGSNILDITLPDGQVVSYKFKKCLIAAGAVAPKTTIYNNKKNIDVASFINMEELPESVAIIGGGALGVEVASFFARFGSKITIIEKNDRLLSSIDPYISKKYEDTLKKRGVTIVTNHDIKKIERVGQKYIALSDAGPIESEEIFLCIGRVPAVSELMLESAGINTDEKAHQIGCVNLNPSTQTQLIISSGSLHWLNLAVRFKNKYSYTEIGSSSFHSDINKEIAVSGFYRAGIYHALTPKFELSGDAAFYHTETLKNKHCNYPSRLYTLQPRINLSYKIIKGVEVFISGGYSWTHSYKHNTYYKHKPTFEGGIILF